MRILSTPWSSPVILLPIVFFSLIPLKSVLAENLLIVEVQIDGGENKAKNDFIKIYNPTDNDFDVSGYKLRKRASTGSESSIRVFPNGSLIKARGYFVWANSEDGFHLAINADTWTKQTLTKNNSIALLDPGDAIVDALAWGQSPNPFFEGAAFPENPDANQQLKRRWLNGSYQDTNNNSQDFYLYPPPATPPPEPEAPSQQEQQLSPGPEQQVEPQRSAEESSQSFENSATVEGTTTQTMFETELKPASAAKEPEPSKIDINTALPKELQKITGVGPVIAQRIIDARPFYSLKELTRVNGIGLKTLENIKKQRLAWVDPALEPLAQGVAAIAEPFKPPGLSQGKLIPKKILVFLASLALAVFSSIAILILKKKLKNTL